MLSGVMCLLMSGMEPVIDKRNILSSDSGSVWWNPSSSSPPEGFEIYQGDILLPSDWDSRNAIKDKNYLWENGIIPYEIRGNFTPSEEAIILEAMSTLEEKTCIKFVKNSGHRTYISLQNERNGCYAPIGRLSGNNGPLPVNLQSPGCFREKGIAVHELLHVAGLFHEQSRTDRDDFVTIHWCNIIPDKEINFVKASDLVVEDFGLPYDFMSIMHYSRLAFSRNGKPTITANSDPEMELGQRKKPTEIDLKKVINMYECEGFE